MSAPLLFDLPTDVADAISVAPIWIFSGSGDGSGIALRIHRRPYFAAAWFTSVA